MMQTTLNERYDTILGEVVKLYLSTGQPVGSRTLAEHSGIALSPASIRNAMHGLEQLGLLAAPHTSAGRVPTDLGLRYFVDALMVVDADIGAQIERRIGEQLRPVVSPGDLVRQATTELANLTHFAGLVSVREPAFAVIRRLDLVPVSSEMVLAVLVSGHGEVQNRLMLRPSGIDDEALRDIGQRLNELLQNCSWLEARSRIEREIESDRLRIRALLAQLKAWADAPTESQPDLFVSGQRHLLQMPEFSVIDTVRSLMCECEEKGNLLRLIDEVEGSAAGVKIFIGSEHALLHMQEASVVLSRYRGEGSLVGTLGVIGPRRMDYEKVVPLVNFTANWLSRMLSSAAGGK